MLQSIKNAVFRATTRLFSCDLQDTIVVAGSPRSGTTWLSEILRELPGYKMLNEPLNLTSSTLASRVDGLEWRTHVPRKASFPELEAVLRQAFTGKVETLHMWRFQSSSSMRKEVEVLTNRKLLVKLVRASRMLPWLSRQFPVRAIVSVFRHPCAVVASQMNYKPEWRNAKPPVASELRATYGQTLPDEIVSRFQSTLAGVESTVERLAALWCLDTYMALQGPMHGNWIVTTYEELLGDTEAELKRILQILGEPLTEGMRAHFREPSNSAARDLATNDEKKQLSKWRSRLTEEQVDAILRIVGDFGLEIYDDALRPHRGQLSARVEQARAGRRSSSSPP